MKNAKDYSKGNIYGNAMNAAALATAIRAMIEDPEKIDNLESYLTQHFSFWNATYAKDPDGLVDEFIRFARIEDPRELDPDTFIARMKETGEI